MVLDAATPDLVVENRGEATRVGVDTAGERVEREPLRPELGAVATGRQATGEPDVLGVGLAAAAFTLGRGC